MKVLHLIDNLGLGGAQTVVRGILESRFMNKKMYLYSLRQSTNEVKIKNDYIFCHNSRKRYSFAAIGTLRRLIAKEKIDVLHCHLFKSFIFGYLLKKLYFPNIKLIFHEHGRIFTNNLLYTSFLRLSKKRVDMYLAVSKATKTNLIEKAKIQESKIRLLYNFVDLEKFSKKNITWNIQKERENLGIKKDEFVIGFAGRLVERKGWKEFVASAKKFPQIKFLIAGDGAERALLEKEIKSLRNVLFLGYYSDMIKFYSLLNCFAIPSHWEGLPMAQLEALAMGLPVISSNGYGLNEVIEDNKNGLMFNVKDISMFCEKINIIFNDKKLRESIIKTSLKNINQYSLNQYFRSLNKYYIEVDG